MLGREGELKTADRSSGEPSSGLLRDVGGMIVEDEFDRGAGRITAIEKLEEFDELSAAMAVSDQGMDLAGEQIDARQQAQRAMAFILVITGKGRVDAGLGRQIRRRRCDGLDSRLFVVGDDRYRLVPFIRLGRPFQDLDLAIDAQYLGHLLLELGVAAFQIVAHLVWLDLLLAEDLAYRALDQVGETFMPRRWSVLARMACQQPRRPQLVRIAVVLRFIARQGHQPSFGFRRDRRLLARSRSVVERCKRAIGHRPFDAALDRLMVRPEPVRRGSPARFESAIRLSAAQSPRWSSPARPPAAILP